MEKHPYIEVESIDRIPRSLQGRYNHFAFQYLDFNEAPADVRACSFVDCLFLGCDIPEDMKPGIGEACLEFPRMGKIYKAFTGNLYTADTLYEGFEPGNEESFDTCFDTRVYQDYISRGKHTDDISETLARAIHDHSMSDAMYELLDGFQERDVVAVMGGHALLRTDPAYRKVVEISKALTEKGRLMVSGGGPGAMEATHLGAWMAGRSSAELDEAMQILAPFPTFRDKGWLSSAFEVIREFPQDRYRSLGVPTWFYGHEPATPFASHIAKYFDNSIREDGILAIAKGGIIYSPGAAGTLQEVFQDAAQNHYQTFGYASPMVFLGVDYYTKEVPVFPLLQDLLERGKYKNLLLSITDSTEEAVNAITAY